MSFPKPAVAQRCCAPLTIVPFEAGWTDGVLAFNQRISEGGWGEFVLPPAGSVAETIGSPVPWEGWLVVEDKTVRGGYLLKRQHFSYSGNLQPTGFYQLSVSEGVIDKRFSAAGMKMATHAVSANPLLFALGMGGFDRPLPRFLKALGWNLQEVPFLFRMRRPGRVLRNIRALRASPLRRFAADVAALSGAGAIGVRVMQTAAARGWKRDRAEAVEVPAFGDWADRVWNECHAAYSMIAPRDSATLNTLYPASFERIHRLQVRRGPAVVGWALVRHTRMNGHKQFGDLHVGTLVDCLSSFEHAAVVVRAATRFLEDCGVDLIVSNQANEVWRGALQGAGYLRGPSNFILAVSRPLSRLLDPFAENAAKAHINRGDGDGPIHL
jgi:hypothetical protein